SGQRLYFVDSASSSARLWTSDGTTAGTVLIGTGILSQSYTQPLFGLNGAVLFQGSDSTTGIELWKSNGTAASTARLADISPGLGNSSPSFLGSVGSGAVFAATDPQHGREIWFTDGTSLGTTLVSDINLGTAGSVPGKPVAVNGRLVFAAIGNSGVNVMQVMASQNATPQVLPVGVGGPVASDPKNVTLVGTRVFFTATVSSVSNTLCVTDGTAAGTRVVRALSDAPLPRNFYAVGERLYFTGGIGGQESIYTSDGTAQGTIVLKGGTLSLYAEDDIRRRRMFAAFHGQLYFVVQPGSGPLQVWKSDGTPEGTGAITNFPQVSPATTLEWLTVTSERLYFLADGGKIYQTDGTSAPSVALGGPYARLDAAGDTLILYTPNLWKFAPGDSAPSALAQVSYYFAATQPSVQVGGWLYFVGSRSGTVGQIWRTDGTVAGTAQVSNGTLATDLTPVGNLLYFTDDDGTSGRELWVTDGTLAGTTRVADIIPGISTSAPANLADWAGTLYFAADDGIHGKELWRDDRTPPTVLSSGFDFAAHPSVVTVQFSENVGGSMSLSDWRLTDRASGLDVSNLLQAVSFDSVQEVARLTLAAGMPDGDYRLTLPAGAVADSAGNAIVGDASFDFFQLTGDINRNRSVDFNDLAIMAQNYNAAGKNWGTGDLNGDGATDFLDLALLAQRYNTSLPDLVAASAAAAVVANVTPAPAVIVKAREDKPSVFNTVQPVSRRPAATPRKVVQRRGR
ncbi:MAG: hypothetical protein JWN40_5125, partial [Phycisphaerales bacterium]|nr:hypothetical protein [Phycisphaerales bacterium]